MTIMCSLIITVKCQSYYRSPIINGDYVIPLPPLPPEKLLNYANAYKNGNFPSRYQTNPRLYRQIFVPTDYDVPYALTEY